MNRRSKKTNDPTSKIAHNVDIDSRLRDAYSQKLSPEPESEPIKPLPNNRVKPNGVLPGSRSTRGESTENQVTQPQVTANSSPSPPPSTSSKHSPPPQHQNSEPTPTLLAPETGTIPPPPVLRKESTGSLEDPNDYFLLRQRSVSETTVQRGNSRPINLVKTVTMPWGQTASMSGVDKSGKTGSKSNTAPRRGSTPAVTSGKQDGSLPTRVLGGGKRSNSPLSNAVGFSHDRDLQLMPTSGGSQEGAAAEEGHWYQAPPTPDDNRPRLVSPPYDTLSRSDSGMSSDRVELGSGIQIHSLKRESSSNSMDDFHLTLASPPLSPVYDHLPTSPPLEENHMSMLSAPSDDFAMRRNVSQPIMIGGRGSEGGGRGGATRSSTSPGPESIAEEEEESEEESRYVIANYSST